MSNGTLKFIAKRYKSTDAVKLSEKTGYSHTHVINTLAGRRNNESIVAAAYKLVSRRQAIA